jgi:hypothetical protein
MTGRPRAAENDAAPVLPHNAEAERAILGAVLLDNLALVPAAQRLRAADFFLPQHRHIFSHMMALDAAGKPVDTVTLMDSLSQSGELENAGGVPYLSQLADGLPKSTNTEHYAAIVKEKAILRSVIYYADAIKERAFRNESSAELLAHGSEALATIGAQQSLSWVDVTHRAKEYEENSELTFSIEGFLQDGGATMIGGLSGHGKTLLMLSISKALLAPRGTKLWGLFRVLEPADRVLYLIPESSLPPFSHRLKLFGLYGAAVAGDRFFSRTLTKGPAIPLDDHRILAAAKGAHVFLDTAMRFSEGSENEAGDNARGLAADIFALLGAGARSIIAAHHSPKAFRQDDVITLENVLRGTGDVGAMLSTA